MKISLRPTRMAFSLVTATAIVLGAGVSGVAAAPNGPGRSGEAHAEHGHPNPEAVRGHDEEGKTGKGHESHGNGHGYGHGDHDDVDVPVADEPSNDDPVVDEPQVDEPSNDDPVVDEPQVDEPSNDDPVVDEPQVDEPSNDDPVIELPRFDEVPEIVVSILTNDEPIAGEVELVDDFELNADEVSAISADRIMPEPESHPQIVAEELPATGGEVSALATSSLIFVLAGLGVLALRRRVIA